MIAVRLEHVRLQLRVVRDARQPNAAIRKRVHLVLHVVPELALMRAFEPGSKLLEHIFQRQLLRRARITMRERHVARACNASTDSEIPTSSAAIGSSDVVSVSIAGQIGRADLCQPCFELLVRQHGFVVDVGPGLRRRTMLQPLAAPPFRAAGNGGIVEFAQPGFEFVARVELAQLFDVLRLHGQ